MFVIDIIAEKNFNYRKFILKVPFLLKVDKQNNVYLRQLVTYRKIMCVLNYFLILVIVMCDKPI